MKGVGLYPCTPLVLALAVLLAACGDGPSGLLRVTPVGFLPVPTLTPAPTEVLHYQHERSDLCPGLSREVCVQPGDLVNIYQAFSMERAVALWLFNDGVFQWALDVATAQRVLRELDREVVLEPWPESASPRVMVAGVVWPPGQGLARYDETEDVIEIVVDVDASVLRMKDVQWAMPDGFTELLLASVAPVTPTPVSLPSAATPTPRQSPTATIVAPGVVFFDHPEGELRWDGPDDRVYSRDRGHCEPPANLRRETGIPAIIVLEEEAGFWFSRVIAREDNWRWTGYYHDEWQIWQGDDGRTVYLVYEGESRIAFEYRASVCF